jgi:tetratricopeptide (TPR) repeat protein
MEATYGERAVEHAAEIARHYHRSAKLPRAERGVRFCLAAAEQAERAAALPEVTEHVRAALDLLPQADPQRPRLLGHLGLTLAWAMRFDDAVAIAGEAATRIAQADTRQAAADYLADVISALGDAGGAFHLFPLVRQGLEYLGERHDSTWAVLKAHEIHEHELNDPTGFSLPLETPERAEVAQLLAKRGYDGIPWNFACWSSRLEFIAKDPCPELHFEVGEYRQCLAIHRQLAADEERRGRLGRAVVLWAIAAQLHIARGEFADAEKVRQHAAALAGRLTEPSFVTAGLLGAEDEWRMAMDEGWDAPMGSVEPMGQGRILGWYQRSISVGAAIARTHARMARVEPAIRRLEAVIPALERAPAGTENYTRVAYDTAETLWLTERVDHIEVIERNLREKVIVPDFRYPMMDGRLALARLCALQRRWEEAVEWFAKARTLLDEQGARPLRAIVDYDEALMYARRDAPGDRERARPLLDAALAQFRSLGMPGWIRRAEALLKSCAAGDTRAEGHSQ